MSFAKNLSPRKVFAVLLGGCIVATLLAGVVAMRTASTIKVGGPLYGQLVNGQNLIADILPPPHFIVEAYANVSQILQSKGETERESLVAAFANLKSDYYASQERWRSFRDGESTSLTTGAAINRERVMEMFDALLVKSHAPAELFFQERNAASFLRYDRETMSWPRRYSQQALSLLSNSTDKISIRPSSSQGNTTKLSRQ